MIIINLTKWQKGKCLVNKRWAPINRRIQINAGSTGSSLKLTPGAFNQEKTAQSITSFYLILWLSWLHYSHGLACNHWHPDGVILFVSSIQF